MIIKDIVYAKKIIFILVIKIVAFMKKLMDAIKNATNNMVIEVIVYAILSLNFIVAKKNVNYVKITLIAVMYSITKIVQTLNAINATMKFVNLVKKDIYVVFSMIVLKIAPNMVGVK